MSQRKPPGISDAAMQAANKIIELLAPYDAATIDEKLHALVACYLAFHAIKMEQVR